MSLAQQFGRPTSFYDGTPGRRTITCPDCGLPADELFGDHGGQCLDYLKIVPPRSGLGVVLRFARTRPEFSSNDTRAEFAALGVKPSGSPFVAAENRGWIEQIGSVPSTDPATKRHRVTNYKSLIYKPARTAS